MASRKREQAPALQKGQKYTARLRRTGPTREGETQEPVPRGGTGHYRSERRRLERGSHELANIDLDAGAQGFAGGLQQRPGYFGADIGFAAILTDLRRNLAHHERGAFTFQRDRGMARAGFAQFAHDALHGFLFS